MKNNFAYSSFTGMVPTEGNIADVQVPEPASMNLTVRNSLNNDILAALESEHRLKRLNSRVHPPHNFHYHQGARNFYYQRPHRWICVRCGLCQIGGDCPTGQCPTTEPYYTLPAWEEWMAQAKEDGTWQRVLEVRGYDFTDPA
jgi:hypothetical protein